MSHDEDLIERALARVAHISEARAAARELEVAARTLQGWREGKRAKMREPMRQKLITKLSGAPLAVLSSVSPSFWDRESRAAESRARAQEKEAEAALERAVAARLAEENARDLRLRISLTERDATTAAVVVEGLEQEDRKATAKRSVSGPSLSTQDRPAADRARDTA